MNSDLHPNDDEVMAARRRRAVYRACHRGTREMDYLLGTFAETCVADMTPDDLTVFEAIILLPDPVLTAALVDHVGEFDAPVAASIERIRRFHLTKAR